MSVIQQIDGAGVDPALDYELNIKLIHKITNKVAGRVEAMNSGYDRDDIFQEISLVWIKCVDKFDSSRGLKFSTYFVRAAFNRVNATLAKEEKAPINFKEHVSNDDGEDVDIFSIREMRQQGIGTQELMDGMEMISRESMFLSDEARSVLSWMITPPDELIEYADYVDSVKERKGASDIGMSVVIAFAKNIMGMNTARMYQVRSEIMTLANKIGEL